MPETTPRPEGPAKLGGVLTAVAAIVGFLDGVWILVGGIAQTQSGDGLSRGFAPVAIGIGILVCGAAAFLAIEAVRYIRGKSARKWTLVLGDIIVFTGAAIVLLMAVTALFENVTDPNPYILISIAGSAVALLAVAAIGLLLAGSRTPATR